MEYKDNLLTIVASMLHDTYAAEDVLHDVFAAFRGAVHKPQPMTDTDIWQMIVKSRFAVPTAIAATILLAFALFDRIWTGKHSAC